MSCAALSEYIVNLLSNPKIIEMQNKIERDMDLENPDSWKGRLYPKYMYHSMDKKEQLPGRPRRQV